MPAYAEVPPSILERVRRACANLPEAYEERAWEGVRWRIRTSTLAHVTTRVHDERLVTAVTFHSVGEEADVLVAIGHPYYPGWGPGLVAMVLTDDGTTDWEELEELLIESYCLLAPKKLVARLPSRPEG